MKLIRGHIATLICCLCAAEWFFKAGLRFYVYELLALLFLMLAFFRATPRAEMPDSLKTYIRLKWAWLLICAASGAIAVLSPLSYSAPPLYFKAVIQTALHTAFFSALALYLCAEDGETRFRLCRAYVLAAAACAAYALLQAFLYRLTGFDTDRLLWAPFTSEFRPDMGIARQAYGPFYRLKGWTGEPNLLASYLLSALPLAGVYLRGPAAATAIGLLSLALLFTMSLSGLGGALISGAILLALRPAAERPRQLKMAALLASLMLLPALIFPSQFLHAAKAKLSPEGTIRSHLDIISTSKLLAERRPLGWGYGTYASVYEHHTAVPGFNAHSTWMTYLVENGVLGLLFQLSIAVFLLWHAARGGAPGHAFAAAYAGLCAAGVFYNTLDSFFANLFIVLFFSASRLQQAAQEKSTETS